MKNILLTILITVSIFVSCNTADKPKEDKAVEEKQTFSTTKKSLESTTYLCKVNGEKWSYTKASGILSKNKKTGKSRAIITFKRKQDKGNESIQLRYDGDTFKLESVLMHLKFPKKGGEYLNGIYQLHPDTRQRNPESDMSGSIDLSNPNVASGNAELIKFNISYEKDMLANLSDAIVSISELNYENVPYSDLNKALEY